MRLSGFLLFFVSGRKLVKKTHAGDIIGSKRMVLNCKSVTQIHVLAPGNNVSVFFKKVRILNERTVRKMILKNEFTMTGVIVAKRQMKNGSQGCTLLTKSGVAAYVGFINQSGTDPAMLSHVIVRGHIRGSVYRDKRNKTQTSQFFIADSIEDEKDLINEGFGISAGHFYKEHYFEYLLAGRVTWLSEQNGYIHMSVETDSPDGKYVLVRVKARKFNGFPDIQTGSNIICVCGVYTRNAGKRELTVNDINIVSEAA